MTTQPVRNPFPSVRQIRAEIRELTGLENLEPPIYAPADPRSGFTSQRYGPIDPAPARTLLTTSSVKVAKTRHAGLGLQAVLYLTPGLLCPMSTRACRRGCLGHSSGRMGMPDSTRARDRRTRDFLADPSAFVARLRGECYGHLAAARTAGLRPVFRFNGTSDLRWETLAPDLLTELSDAGAHLLDYTKIPGRAERSARGEMPGGYWICYSVSESAASERRAVEILRAGGSAAVVFRDAIPDTWNGFPVVDGTAHDFRSADEAGTVVGLLALGREMKGSKMSK